MTSTNNSSIPFQQASGLGGPLDSTAKLMNGTKTVISSDPKSSAIARKHPFTFIRQSMTGNSTAKSHTRSSAASCADKVSASSVTRDIWLSPQSLPSNESGVMAAVLGVVGVEERPSILSSHWSGSGSSCEVVQPMGKQHPGQLDQSWRSIADCDTISDWRPITVVRVKPESRSQSLDLSRQPITVLVSDK